MSENQKSNPVRLGEKLSFQIGFDIEKYLLDGWSAQEQTHRWTVDDCAGLQLHLSELGAQNIILRVECLGYFDGGKLDHQTVEVLVNNSKVATWTVRQKAWHEAVVPNWLVKNGDMNVSFLISNPSAPFDSGLSADKRKLGLCVLSVEIIESDNVKPDNPVLKVSTNKPGGLFVQKKKLFAVYGNCQCQIIARYLNSDPAFSAEFDYLDMPAVYEMTPEKFSEFKFEASKLAILIFQNVGSGAYSSSEILSQLPRQCKRIKIPSLFFNGYNPEMAYLRQSGATLFYHDRIMLKYIDDFEGFQRRLLIDSDFFPESFSKDCVDASLNELMLRENSQNVDVRIADFIAEYYKKYRLFYVMNHPTDILIREVASRVLRLLGMKVDIADNISVTPLDQTQFPIYLSHFMNLGIEFANEPVYVRTETRLSVANHFAIRKAEYANLDLDFARQDVFAFKKPVFRGEDMAGGFQF